MKILAVDDNEINLDLVSEIILMNGWEVLPAMNGHDALRIAHASQPDLILLDVSMPGMSGYEVCARLKADPATASIPVIMLTALNEIDDRVRGLDAGADDYLAKPFGARELVARINTRRRAKEEADALREMQQVIRATFERFVAPSVVTQLLDNPASVRLGGQLQEVTVLFADLENFTTISEVTSPENLLNVLNSYHELLVRVVLETGGTVDKFMGDALMALYNTPLPQPDHVARAVRGALGIQAALPDFHAQLEPAFRMNVNIGVHTGMAVVGNVGASQIMDFTAVGDTVNIAARLQHASSGGRVLVSQAVYDSVRNQPEYHGLQAEMIGALMLKGRTESVVTYAIRQRQPA